MSEIQPNKKLPKTDVDIRPIRTFQDDMAQAVEKQQESAISLSVKEAEKKQKEARREVSERANKSVSKTGLTFMSMFFLIGGSIVLGYFYWQSRPTIEERSIIETIIIADAEQTENLDGLNKESFIERVRSVKKETKQTGTITHLKLIEQTIGKVDVVSPQEFLRFIGARTPSALTRSMTGDMMFGFISLGETNIPFWIVEVDSFESAFSGTLDWETLLTEDFGPILSTSSLPLDPVFTDVVIRNRDTRILVNEQEQDVLLHSFLDRNTLLITENRDAFRELLPLFIASKQIR